MEGEEIMEIIDKWEEDNNYCLTGYEKEFILDIINKCFEKFKSETKKT